MRRSPPKATRTPAKFAQFSTIPARSDPTGVTISQEMYSTACMTTLPKPPLFSSHRQNRRRVASFTVSESTWSAARATLVYLGIGLLWILFSDKVVDSLVQDIRTLETIEIYKGWFFVAVTAAVLFWRLRAKLERSREQEEKLALFIEYAPVALAMLDRNMCYITTSRHWNSDYALGERDLRGLCHYEVFPGITAAWREAHRRALAGETLSMDADQMIGADGSVKWLRWEARPWLDGTGKVGGIVLLTEDITSRKVAEEALTRSQTQTRIALDAGHAGTWSWDLINGLVECDEAAASLYGRSREEFSRGGAELFTACIHPDDRDQTLAALTVSIRDHTDFIADYRIVRPDGTTLWLADRGRPEYNGFNHAIRMVGACADVTELKRVQHALHESERRFREVVETIRDVFWVRDVASNRIVYISPAYEEIWGRSADELYKNPQAWAASIHTEDRDRVVAAATAEQLSGEYDETFRVVRPDLTERWVHAHSYQVKDGDGNVVRIIGTAEDVTDRKGLEDQFLRAQRLEAIGTLASGVAHDLNNILAPMFMVAPLLKEKVSDPADIHLLSIIESSAQRGANVVRQLLTFSRGIAGDRGPLQVRHLVKEMVAIMQETFPREIKITQEVPSDLPAIVGDGTQIHQVLMNLCVNARDAMPDGGTLTVGATVVTVSAEAATLQPGAKPGPYVVVSVGDTGHGIPPEVRNRIFEPFFTTKELGKGTGLGLSTVLGIVKSHGGFLTVDSEVGYGTRFQVYLPVVDLAMDTSHTVHAQLSPSRGETVLIVDDEQPVLTALQRILEKQGYQVLTASDGREALGVFLLEQTRIRAIVTDLMMPEMGGIALVRAVRALAPAIPIIAATGLDSSEKRNALAALSVRMVIPKPYTSEELLTALVHVLQPAEAGIVE
jgi:PAS domain S-box-containing protein